jgi:signal transduction histidine kinase
MKNLHYPNISKANILIVDDTHAHLRLLTRLLAVQGYIVRPVPDGELALASASASPPDLILLDIKMPGMSGYELCEHLKANEHTRAIPIIFLSAVNDILDKVKAFAMGGVDYITKPFQPEEVLARVATHLNLLSLRKQLEEQNAQLQREIAERMRVEAELQRHQEHLEERVQAELEQRRQQEQLLIQKSKLESLGSLAAGIAHEINQPLTRIAIGAESLLLKAVQNEPVSPEYLEKKCQIIQESINRITQIIDHIRTFSRDQQVLRSERVDVNATVSNALSFVQTQYQHHNILIQTDFQATGWILGNQYKLEQVIFNLFSNAKDAIEAKYTSLESAFQQRIIHVRTSSSADQIYVEVEDTGIGISPETIEHIFDPFFTTKEIGKGTGLGLSISYGIIKEMHGDISVTSRVNEGTIMKISLPKIPQKLEIAIK